MIQQQSKINRVTTNHKSNNHQTGTEILSKRLPTVIQQLPLLAGQFNHQKKVVNALNGNAAKHTNNRKRSVEPRPHPPHLLNKRYWDEVKAGRIVRPADSTAEQRSTTQQLNARKRQHQNNDMEHQFGQPSDSNNGRSCKQQKMEQLSPQPEDSTQSIKMQASCSSPETKTTTTAFGGGAPVIAASSVGQQALMRKPSPSSSNVSIRESVVANPFVPRQQQPSDNNNKQPPMFHMRMPMAPPSLFSPSLFPLSSQPDPTTFAFPNHPMLTMNMPSSNLPSPFGSFPHPTSESRIPFGFLHHHLLQQQQHLTSANAAPRFPLPVPTPSPTQMLSALFAASASAAAEQRKPTSSLSIPQQMFNQADFRLTDIISNAPLSGSNGQQRQQQEQNCVTTYGDGISSLLFTLLCKQQQPTAEKEGVSFNSFMRNSDNNARRSTAVENNGSNDLLTNWSGTNSTSKTSGKNGVSASDEDIDQMLDRIVLVRSGKNAAGINNNNVESQIGNVISLRTKLEQKERAEGPRLCIIPLPIFVPIPFPLSSDFVLKHFQSDAAKSHRQI